MASSYTIPYFIREINKLNNKCIEHFGIADALCTRKGVSSVKFRKLSMYLGYFATGVARGSGDYYKLGKTPKTRLIKALQLRKKYGFHCYNPVFSDIVRKRYDSKGNS